MSQPEWWSDEKFRDRMVDVQASQSMKIRKVLESHGLEQRMAAGVAGQLVVGYRSQAAELAESPIEVLFLMAFGVHKVTNHRLAIQPQRQVGKYRVDVAICEVGDWDGRLHIELDGHQFHERTKEQAERDRSRDRWFALQGMRLIRFTGREVWRDPEKCVTEAVESYFADRARRSGGEVPW